MYILGINGGFSGGVHDGACTLVQDGRIVAAAEDERFTNIKHAENRMPVDAVHYCLRQAGIAIRDVDYVAYYVTGYPGLEEQLARYFQFNFDYVPKIRLVQHHLAHAASTFRTSGFDEAMIITSDYSGDGISTVLHHATAETIAPVKSFRKPNSLGIYYAAMTEFLGFSRDSDEYKIMGLASYGQPTENLDWLLTSSEGDYALDTSYVNISDVKRNPSKQESIYSPKLIERIGHRRRLPAEPLTAYHKNMAASVQKKLETAFLDLLKGLSKQTGLRKLCLAGGVALNGVMVQKLWESGLVDEIHLCSASNDSGTSMGAAIQVAHEEGVWKQQRCNTAYLGPSYASDEIQAWLDVCKLPYRRSSNAAQEASERIAQGDIVGWFQGRLEFGPRALGNRSILANPCMPDMKERINACIKFREDFRPFAPSLPEEKTAEFFEKPHTSPYMTMTLSVRPEKRSEIPSVTHFDGTARLQTVSKDSNTLYHDLISRVGRATGTPVVLNTSFNVKGQPMVNSPKQAISTFYSTGIDVLFLGDYVIEKK